jgi:hypothetical protein
MDKQHILSRFEKEAAALENCDPFSLASLFAERLSMLSDRLTEDEFEELIRIGAGIFQYGIRECGESIPVDDLLPAKEVLARKIKSSIYE